MRIFFSRDRKERELSASVPQPVPGTGSDRTLRVLGHKERCLGVQVTKHSREVRLGACFIPCWRRVHHTSPVATLWGLQALTGYVRWNAGGAHSRAGASSSDGVRHQSEVPLQEPSGEH